MSHLERMPTQPGRMARIGMMGAGIVAALVLITLLQASPLSAQAAASSRANDLFFPGGPGGSSDSGRFLSDMSTSTREVERVPINVRSMADGTAGTVRPESRERRRNVGGAIVPDGPVYQYLYPTAAVPSTYYRTAPAPAVAPTPAYGGVGRRAPAGRLPRVPERAPGAEGSSSSAPAVEAEVAEPAAPMIRPPVAAEEGLRIAPEDCVEVRLTTAGGIEWRNRVSMVGLGAETVHGAHQAILNIFERGETLILEGLDGRFEIRPSQVQSYIVGPCNSVVP